MGAATDFGGVWYGYDSSEHKRHYHGLSRYVASDEVSHHVWYNPADDR